MLEFNKRIISFVLVLSVATAVFLFPTGSMTVGAAEK